MKVFINVCKSRQFNQPKQTEKGYQTLSDTLFTKHF